MARVYTFGGWFAAAHRVLRHAEVPLLHDGRSGRCGWTSELARVRDSYFVQALMGTVTSPSAASSLLRMGSGWGWGRIIAALCGSRIAVSCHVQLRVVHLVRSPRARSIVGWRVPSPALRLHDACRSVGHLGVDRRRLNLLVPQQLLHRPQIPARRRRQAFRSGAGRCVLSSRHPHRALQRPLRGLQPAREARRPQRLRLPQPHQPTPPDTLGVHPPTPAGRSHHHRASRSSAMSH